MKLRHFFPCLLLAGMAVTMASCSEEATLTPGQGRNVRMTVNISRQGDATRSILTEEGGDLKCTWEAEDLVLVVDNAGNKIGVLHLTSGAGEVEATFTGEINTAAEGNTQLGFLYLGPQTETEIKALESPVEFSYAEQDGSLDWLSRHDFFSATHEVNITNSYASVEDVTLARLLAFGKFEMSFPENVTYSGEDITVSGTGIHTQASVSIDGGVSFSNAEGNEGVITVKPVAGSDGSYSTSFYLTVLPNGEEQIEPTFSVTIDDTEYTCTLGPRTWTASEFVRVANSDGSFSGIELGMATPKVDLPDTSVGPTFIIGNKKYRFTSGNLWYNYQTKQYGIYDTQIEYLGKWYNNSQNTTKVIDLFSWATTGLDQSRAPEYFWESSTKYGGCFPTADQTLNYSIYDVVNQHDRMYDFGYAYIQSGRVEGDDRDYRIPTKDQLKSLFNGNAGCFFQGCTVKENGKDIYGTIVIPNISNASDAKALIDKIKETGENNIAYSSSYLKDINLQYGKEYNVGAITITGYDNLKKLNNALFFPAAGHVSVSQGSTTPKQSRYWSGEASTINSAQRNAYGFYYDVNNGFKYNDSSGAYIKAAIRLLVEVDD